MTQPIRNARTGKASTLLLVSICFLAGLAASAGWLYLRGRESRRAAGSAETTGAAPDTTRPQETPHQTATDEERARAAAELLYGRRNAVVKAAERIGPAVVTVITAQIKQEFVQFWSYYLPGARYLVRAPAGTGFIVDPNGYVLTNYHVIQGGRDFDVVTSDGRSFSAKLLGADPFYDLAVLKIEGANLSAVATGNSDDLYVGEWAIALGNPFGTYLKDPKPTVTVGVISALHRDVQEERAQSNDAAIYKDLIQTDAAINPGNSGGPLVNSLGEVIGINTLILSRSGGSEGIGFAIPINTAMRVYRDFRDYGRARILWTGMDLREISVPFAIRAGLQDPRGLIVVGVAAGSPAERAGVRPVDANRLTFDILREIDGETVTTSQQVTRLLFGKQPGDRITATVERQGKRIELPITLELSQVADDRRSSTP